jgi:hypothetical protein
MAERSAAATSAGSATYTDDIWGKLYSIALSGSPAWQKALSLAFLTSNGQYGNMSCSLGSSGYCPQVSFDKLTNRMTSIGSTVVGYDTAGNLTSDGTYTPTVGTPRGGCGKWTKAAT